MMALVLHRSVTRRGPLKFVGASPPGTEIVEVADVASAVHFATEASARAYVDARSGTRTYSTQWVTVGDGIAVAS